MPPILTIGELTSYIRVLFEEDFRLQDLWLTGEVSNLSRSAAGHLFFTLKDDQSQIRCVMWRSQVTRLDRLPAHGEALVAHGRIGVYEVSGAYQLYVDELQFAGVGALHAQFEALRDRLRAEGLFDRSRPLPRVPRHIGVVTSPQAAAWRDVLTTLGRRWPGLQVTLAPTLVQGVDAPGGICAALAALNQVADLEAILVVRGGGSLEDLWAFNDESVARAIWECRVPVVSGVGHETDFTITDFVADVRAPTPTAAAELATPDRREWAQRALDLTDRLGAAIEATLDEKGTDLARVTARLERLSPQRQIDERRRRLADLDRRARQALTHRLALARAETAGQAARLATLDPRATLRRGYAIVVDADTGEVVRTVREARAGRGLRVHVADGSFETTVGRQRRLLDS